MVPSEIWRRATFTAGGGCAHIGGDAMKFAVFIGDKHARDSQAPWVVANAETRTVISEGCPEFLFGSNRGRQAHVCQGWFQTKVRKRAVRFTTSDGAYYLVRFWVEFDAPRMQVYDPTVPEGYRRS